MQKAEWNKAVYAARKTNARRDKQELRDGFSPPWRGRLSGYLSTILAAIEAGAICNDTAALAEGYAMLQDLEGRIRAVEERPI